jgi:uncharacterized damage-inducible protein DinB
MALVDALLPELDHEVAVTRKLLERVPEDHSGWKPHAKASSLAQLATHVANLPHWGVLTISQAELDLDGAGTVEPLTSRAALLAAFDEKSTAFRHALAGRSDGELMAPWTLKQKGKVIFTMPKAAVLRSFVMNHLIHHRGQLSVYLRQLDVPLPSIYGPSADENPF